MEVLKEYDMANGVRTTPVDGLINRFTTSPLITAATVLTLADSGGAFVIDQDAAFDIDLPAPPSNGSCEFEFVIGDAGANDVTITVKDAAATFIGTIVNDTTSVIPATGATLTFASGVAAVGDRIRVKSVGTDKYVVDAATTANGGITVA